jgi:hypothetical protein
VSAHQLRNGLEGMELRRQRLSVASALSRFSLCALPKTRTTARWSRTVRNEAGE